MKKTNKFQKLIDGYTKWKIKLLNKEVYRLVKNRNILQKKLLRIPVLASTNETMDGFFVPYIDYDNVAVDCVLKDLIHLNKVFGYCTFIVARSSLEVIPTDKEPNIVGNYHVRGLDKAIYHQHLDSLRHTRCDWRLIHDRPPYSARNWVLRESLKGDKPAPIFVKLVHFNGSCSYQHSLAHRILYERMYGIKINGINNFDKFEKPEMIEYLTSV